MPAEDDSFVAYPHEPVAGGWGGGGGGKKDEFDDMIDQFRP